MSDFDTSYKQIKKIAQLCNEQNLQEIEYQEGDLYVKITKALSGYTAHPSPVHAPAIIQPAITAPAVNPATTPTVAATRQGEVITSPMVGVAYLQSEPNSPAFVKVGDRISKGQTLLIIEAMKVMNPLPSPRDGIVKEIIVRDSSPVEFGDELIVLE